MKILLINKFHYMKGGTETFHFNLAEELKAAGHEVIYFSMQDDRNIPCDQDKYFVSNIDYNNPNLSIIEKVKLASKLIYSFEAKRKIEQLIIDEKPDIAHIGLLHRQLTFSVVDALKKHNIPVVMHLHELSCVCPCYTMLRPNGTICRECIEHGFTSCIKYKCMKNSFSKSLLAYFEATYLKLGKYYNKIDLYIAECKFYENIVKNSAFTTSPIIQKNNFLPMNQEYKSHINHENYILYFGRYAREKGIMTLLKAYSNLECREKLVLVGGGSELPEMMKFIEKNNLSNRVEVNGPKFGSEMEDIIKKAKIVVVPSEWYENGAFVALQAMAMGKIVIASNIAGLSEIFVDGVTGYLAEPGNVDDYIKVISNALSMTDSEYKKMSFNAVNSVKNRCDSKKYIDDLLDIYDKLINKQ